MVTELTENQPCNMCDHYRGGSKCSAYPQGIPSDILDNFSWVPFVSSKEDTYTAPSPTDPNDHRIPINGDNGIQWQANNDDLDIELRTAWWGSDRSKWPVNPHK